MQRLCVDLHTLIFTFLDVRSLVFWRAVNRKAYQQVEDATQSFMSQEQLTFTQYVYDSTSLWFNFVQQYYECLYCNKFENVNSVPSKYYEASLEELCLTCFNQSKLRYVHCSLCYIFKRDQCCIQCYKCKNFWCATCSQDCVQKCLACNTMFCDSCSINDLCDYCL